MKKVLFFRLGNNNYLFYLVDGTIRLSRVKNKKFLNILNSDKKVLHSFIENLCDKNFNSLFLKSNGITILNFNDIEISCDCKFVELVFSGNKRRTFFRNCSMFYSKKHGFVPIVSCLLGFFIIGFCVFHFSISKSSVKVSTNKDLLSNYLVTSDRKYDYRIINVSTSNMTNFNDSYISFYNIFGKYSVISRGEVNVYSFKNFRMDVSVNRDYYSEFDYSEDFSDSSLISLDEVFLRYNISNKMDLFYNCLINSDKYVDKDSLDSDIIDKYVFDYYSDLLIPKGGEISIIFLTGDKYGYIIFDNDNISIILKKNDDQYNIKFYNISNKLSVKNVIEFIYSLHLK